MANCLVACKKLSEEKKDRLQFWYFLVQLLDPANQ